MQKTLVLIPNNVPKMDALYTILQDARNDRPDGPIWYMLSGCPNYKEVPALPASEPYPGRNELQGWRQHPQISTLIFDTQGDTQLRTPQRRSEQRDVFHVLDSTLVETAFILIAYPQNLVHVLREFAQYGHTGFDIQTATPEYELNQYQSQQMRLSSQFISGGWKSQYHNPPGGFAAGGAITNVKIGNAAIGDFTE